MKSFFWFSILVSFFLTSCSKDSLVVEIPPMPKLEKYIITLDSNSRTFVQRSNDNIGTVVFSAKVNQRFARAEIKFDAYFGGQSTNWQALTYDVNQSSLVGKFDLKGGGYYPKVTLYDDKNNKLFDTLFLKHFSVGEAFAVIGHSLAEGQAPYHLNDYNMQWSMIDLWPILSPESTNGPAFWGRMADLLRNRLNCPVMVYNTGIGGSNSLFWGNSAYGLPFESKLFDWTKRYPYIFFEDKIKQTMLKTGLRAILVVHGENDVNLSSSAIIKHTNDYIRKTRELFNANSLSFCIAKSLPNYSDLRAFDGVIEAQKRIPLEIPYTFYGADLQSIKDRWDNIHFNYNGLEKAASAWNQALTDDFFKKSIPVLSQK